MITKLKKIKLLIGLLTLLILASCRTDKERFSGTTNTFKTSKISLSDLEKIPNAYQKINQISNLENSKIIIDTIHNFSIDTDLIIKTESGTYNSFTFPITRNYETTILENLVLSSKNDGTYQVFIVSYNLTFAEKEIIRNHQFVNLQGKSSIIKLDNFDTNVILKFKSNSSR